MLRENKLQHRKSAFLEEITISNFALQSKKKKKKGQGQCPAHLLHKNNAESGLLLVRVLARHSFTASAVFFLPVATLAREMKTAKWEKTEEKKKTHEWRGQLVLTAKLPARMHARTHARTHAMNSRFQSARDKKRGQSRYSVGGKKSDDRKLTNSSWAERTDSICLGQIYGSRIKINNRINKSECTDIDQYEMTVLHVDILFSHITQPKVKGLHTKPGICVS